MSERKKTLRAKQNNSISISLIASSVWGTILWLFAILSEMWVSRTVTMTIATMGTLLWMVSLIAICRMAVSAIHTRSSCKDYSVSVPRDMLTEYIQAALEREPYKLIDNSDEPRFVDVPD